MNGEKDPTGRDSSVPGAKLDAGKIRMGLVLGGFSKALMEVSKVGTFGAAKYSDDGWKSVPGAEKRYMDALLRHAFKHMAGETVDPEWKLLHLAHCAWNCLAVLEKELAKAEPPACATAGNGSAMVPSTHPLKPESWPSNPEAFKPIGVVKIMHWTDESPAELHGKWAGAPFNETDSVSLQCKILPSVFRVVHVAQKKDSRSNAQGADEFTLYLEGNTETGVPFLCRVDMPVAQWKLGQYAPAALTLGDLQRLYPGYPEGCKVWMSKATSDRLNGKPKEGVYQTVAGPVTPWGKLSRSAAGRDQRYEVLGCGLVGPTTVCVTCRDVGPGSAGLVSFEADVRRTVARSGMSATAFFDSLKGKRIDDRDVGVFTGLIED